MFSKIKIAQRLSHVPNFSSYTSHSPKQMKSRVVICGKAGSGKDFLRDALRDRGNAKCDLSVTTRPPRATEKDGVAYHFCTNEKFIQLREANGFYEYVTFNGWHYGTLLDSWKSSHIFIMTPGGIKSITPEDRQQTHILFLDIPADVRKERLSKRTGDADSVERRLESDEKDFSDFFDFDQRITDPLFDSHEMASYLEMMLCV